MTWSAFIDLCHNLYFIFQSSLGELNLDSNVHNFVNQFMIGAEKKNPVISS